MDKSDNRRCNICLKRKKMSADHIFPKAITKQRSRKITDLGQRLGIKDANSKSRHAQNGYTRKTICEKCNNQVLGLNLDLALNDFCEKLSKELGYLKFLSNNSIPLKGIRLREVMRAVSGHILAHTSKPAYKQKFYKSLRRFVLRDESDPKLRIIMWLYPFNDQVIIDNIVKTSTKIDYTPVGLTVYKTFPIAFAFIYDNNSYQLPSTALYEITKNPTCMFPKAVNFYIRAKPLMDRVWPEAPYEHEMVLTNTNSGMQTLPHNKIKAYKH